jgi:hypothetical protein
MMTAAAINSPTKTGNSTEGVGVQKLGRLLV